MSDKQKLVVIGNGMAGARAVEEILARGGRDLFDIVMFGDEPYGNYNRILLSGVLGGTHNDQDIFINPLNWYEENNIRLHAGVRAGWIDRTAKCVYAAGGVAEPYDKLIIATGSHPYIPAMSGLKDTSDNPKAGVFVFRTLDDCHDIIKMAETSKRAAVIGGGLLGLEAARGLVSLGLEVDVIHLAGYLMEAQLDAPAGALLQKALESTGVRFHLGMSTTAILGDDRATGLTFRDGTTLDTDMVVISCGIVPNVELAKACGLSVERAIVVHNDMSCRNDDNIYALGECIQHQGKVYGLVAPIWEQAQVMADVLTGRNPQAAYRGSRLSTKLKVMGVDLAVMGIKDGSDDDDEVITYSEPKRGIYKKLIIRNGALAGAIVLGENPTTASLVQTFERGTEVPDNRAELLFPLSSEEQSINVAELADNAQICNCNGVSKGKIVAAVQGGLRTLKAVCDGTRAGTGCGSCKFQVQALLEYAGGGLIAEDPSAHFYVPGVPLTKPELIAAIRAKGLRSVSSVFAELAGGKEDVGSRVGLASLLKTIWAGEYDDERDARFINDRVHANIQKDGTFSVIPRIYGGVTSADQLRRIADVADKHNVPMVKITGGQRIDLLGIAKDKLPEVWQDLGMPSGHAYTKAFRTCKTCVGTDFCRYGVGDSTKLGIEIETHFQGIESPHKMKLAASGCPRNCAESTTKDLGAVAIEGGKWEVYIGGAAGSKVRKGDILVVAESHEEVLKYMGRFMQYYRENAKYLERTYDFVERLGIARIKLILVEDSEGICERLDQEVAAATAAYVDPWQEAEHPMNTTQFAKQIPVAATTEAR